MTLKKLMRIIKRDLHDNPLPRFSDEESRKIIDNAFRDITLWATSITETPKYKTNQEFSNAMARKAVDELNKNRKEDRVVKVSVEDPEGSGNWVEIAKYLKLHQYEEEILLRRLVSRMDKEACKKAQDFLSAENRRIWNRLPKLNPLVSGADCKPPKRNIAQVVYEKCPNGIFRIVELNNFLCHKEISVKYGERVAEIYFDGSPCMYFHNNRAVHLFYQGPVKDQLTGICIGLKLSKDDFSNVIATMKKCGQRLSNIIREERKKQIGTIKPGTIFKNCRFPGTPADAERPLTKTIDI